MSLGRHPSRLLALVSGMFVALALAFPIPARTDLVRAEPSANASLTGGPANVRLVFSTPPDPKQSTIAVYTTER